MSAQPDAGPTVEDDLETLASTLGTNVARAYMSIRRPLLEHDISFAQMRVLSILQEQGPQRITQLAHIDQVKQPSLSVMVDRMEQLGWAKRMPDPTDGRAVIVTITPAGSRQLSKVRSIRSRALAERLKQLPAHVLDDVRTAVQVLEDLVVLLDESEDD